MKERKFFQFRVMLSHPETLTISTLDLVKHVLNSKDTRVLRLWADTTIVHFHPVL